MNKRLLIVGFALGLIGLFFVAKPLIAPTIERQVSSVTDKTYANTNYSFQFRYPANWQIDEWNIQEAANLQRVADGTIIYQGKFFGPSGHFEVLVWSNKAKASVRQWLTWYRHEDLILTGIPPKENFMLSGVPAIRFLQKETSRKKPVLFIFIALGEKIYELTEERDDLKNIEATNSAKFLSPTFDRILESFQFIK